MPAATDRRQISQEMKKNDQIVLTITDMGTGGEGIGRADGYTFFVKNAVAGDEVRALITKMNKNYGFAKVLEILTPSPDRVIPPCPNAQRCGGCQIMQLDYKEQLKLKERRVRENLIRLGGQKDPPVRPIIGMDGEGNIPLHYRNKVQFPAGKDAEGRIVTGFYAGRTHYIIGTESCPVSMEPSDRILKMIRDFLEKNSIDPYNENDGTGLVRHVLIRQGYRTGQIMVCLVINGKTLGSSLDGSFVRYMLSSGLNITSICLNINTRKTNVILGPEVISLYGPGYIEDRIGDLTFRISPLAFFQVNSVQTEKLYSKALEYASLTGEETVWDLYCGTGTISLFLAQRAKKVFGAEIIQAAIDNANENAALNGMTNVEFFCGKSEEIFPEYYKDCADGSPDKAAVDVVVLDPPRKGCDEKLLKAILKVRPERIVYVSCDSATLARDIKILSSEYELKEATPVDMFPHTVHVETVCLLSKLVEAKNHISVQADMEEMDLTAAAK